MDKNMIHIDDLVKLRLSGGEEQEMSGSWLRMRELLDKEMPEKKRIAGYYNWRRMYGVMTGLALLSVLTVGGYNILTSTKFNSNKEKAKEVATTNMAVNTALPEKNIPASNKQAAQVNTVSNGASVVSQKSIAYSNPKKEENKSSNKTSKGNSKTIVLNHTKTSKHNATAKAANREAIHTASNKKIIAANTVSTKSNNTSANVLKENESAAKSVQAIRQKTIAKQDIDDQRTAEKTFASAINHTNNNRISEISGMQPTQNFETAGSADNTRLKTTPAPVQPDRTKDTLNKLTIVQRLDINPLTRVGLTFSDTVAVERFTVDKIIAANDDREIAGADKPMNVVPSSTGMANKEIAATSESLVPLSNYKVQSRRTSRWNARSFDEVVRDVKFNLAQTKFYPGISIGGNSYMFGPNNIGGFQLGLFGLFTFGETWSAMGELKYIHRFNGGKTLNDDYVDVIQKQGSYLQGNVRHFFRFTSLQSIEMPLALRYAAGRLNLFGGLNLAYHFAVNADEQTFRPADTAYTPFNNPNKIKGQGVQYDDFKARFALGGLLGISWEISPSIQLDLRASKDLWDNAYGLGAERVSTELYNAPSMQFSLFYRFSQRNQIPKAK